MKPSTESHNTKKTSLEEIDLAWPEEEASDRAAVVSRLWNRLGVARRSSLLPEVGLPARPGLLVLTALLLIALCALLATWRFQPRPTEAGIPLLADSSSSKLNNASAASAEAVAPTLTRELETPVKLRVEESGPAVVATPLSDAKGPDLASFVPPASVVPVPPSQLAEPGLPEQSNTVQNAPRGDTPMTQTWKKLGLQTVLAAAVTTFPVWAADPELKPGDYTKQFEEVQKQLKDIKTALADLPPVKADTKKLREDATAQGESSKLKFEDIQRQLRELKTTLGDLEAIKTDLKNLKDDTNVNVQAAQMKINALSDRMGRLEDAIAGLKTQMQSQPRISSFPPTPAPPPPAVTGRIRLSNTFTTPVTVFVNQRAYTLFPNETRDLESQPAGPFQYEVLASSFGVVQPRRTVSLNPNETFTISVYTR